jgi:DHA1 family bicyclomycin/chloramphenicol resistance-like MFS transporter
MIILNRLSIFSFLIPITKTEETITSNYYSGGRYDQCTPQCTKQSKNLGKKGLIAFIALMNMFIPLSTDMYLPHCDDEYVFQQQHFYLTNLTLSGFFLFYAVGILFWGPLSDKFGRDPFC